MYISQGVSLCPFFSMELFKVELHLLSGKISRITILLWIFKISPVFLKIEMLKARIQTSKKRKFAGLLLPHS